jgi:acyl-CoA thioesterase I
MKSLTPQLAFLILFSVVSPRAADTIHVSCVGNSITDGTGLAGRDTACYPARLQRLLGPGYNVLNCGVAGTTMLKNGNKPYWTFGASLFRAAMSFLPKIVILDLGTNDSKGSGGVDNWPSHKDEFIYDYAAMVDTFANLSSRPKVWACYPLPAYSTAYNIDSMVIHYEIQPKIKAVVLAKGIPLIDLFTWMSGQPSLFADGIHPNAAGYLKMATKIYQMLQSDTLKIVQEKNRLQAPSGGSLYQWYRQGTPVAAASGGTAEVLIAKDTGTYKVSVGVSHANDDILVTGPVHVSTSDIDVRVSIALRRDYAPPVNGYTRLYHVDGSLALVIKTSANSPPSTLLPRLPSGVYLAKTQNTAFRYIVP